MDAQTLLDNFATIAEAPGGVQRLRDLVLDLAVSGRLVDQNPHDEHAVMLLRSIAEKQLVAPSALTEPVTVDDALWNIPNSWCWARLKQLCDLTAGRTPPTKDSTFWAGSDGHPWVAIGDIPAGGKVCKTARSVSDKARDEIFRGEPDPVGTVLMSFKLTIGKMARLAVPAFHNEAIVKIATPVESTREYLFRVLPLLTKSGNSKAAIMGSTLNRTSLTNLLIPLPPLAEQERIVAKVDELLGLCDDLQVRQDHKHLATTRFRGSTLHALTSSKTPGDVRSAWERASTNWPALTDQSDSIDDVRQSILQLAVEGHLVAQDLNDHPAKAELQAARTTKAAATGGLRGQPPLPPQADLLESDLPNGWVWAQVDDAFLVTGGIQKSPKRQPHENHYPYLRVANVQRGRLDLREIERFELFDGELDRLRLARGDLLVVEGNGSETEIGRCARWDGQIDNCVHQNHIIRCRPMVPGLEHYLLLFLNSPAGKATMKNLAVTTSGLYNLSVAKIRAIRFPMPPTAEQVRIRRNVDELGKCCDLLESKLAQRQTIATHLAESAVRAIAL
jgi:type I restriction enzyme S subunit